MKLRRINDMLVELLLPTLSTLIARLEGSAASGLHTKPGPQHGAQCQPHGQRGARTTAWCVSTQNSRNGTDQEHCQVCQRWWGQQGQRATYVFHFSLLLWFPRNRAAEGERTATKGGEEEKDDDQVRHIQRQQPEKRKQPAISSPQHTSCNTQHPPPPSLAHSKPKPYPSLPHRPRQSRWVFFAFGLQMARVGMTIVFQLVGGSNKKCTHLIHKNSLQLISMCRTVR